MITKTPSSKPGYMLITFELPSAIWAEKVSLVGEFNDWSRTSHLLRQSRDDSAWRIILELPAGHEYQFRYLVNDSDWHNDWHADKYVPNPYGGDNSVVAT
ncbi:MAG: isoamylase early set domain-containing protein [Anaerolineae bacterium]|nr:isoamylase early set domain-containing protein [Anaerolineae bacterium]